MKKIIIIFLLFLGILKASPSFGEAFVIKNYDVNLRVNENKLINVKENIDTYFTEKKHGIYRLIPLTNNIARENYSVEKINAKLRNVSANKPYRKTILLENGNKAAEIRLGSEDNLVFGNQDYIIRYDYIIPKSLKLKNKDELYFNIIGDKWNTTIEKVHFMINLPKDFDSSKIEFYIGEYGAKKYDKNKLSYSVYGNTIEGNILSPLNKNEAVTIRVELPEDYFNYSNFDKTAYVFAAVLVILTFITFLMWHKIGKDEIVIPVVNFYPPDNLNSADIGSFYREGSNDKDVVSLIVYLASKGYIKIENGYDEDFSLIKLKEYDGTCNIEKCLMESLFEDNEKEVGRYNLDESPKYYNTCESIKASLNKKVKKLYEAESTNFTARFIPGISILTSTIILILSLSGYDYSYCFSSKCLPLLIFIVVGLITFQTNYKINPVSAGFFTLFCMVFPLIRILFSVDLNFDFLLPLSIICLIVNIVCFIQMPKKNKTALKLMGRIFGFKKFLETAEKHNIEILVKENPSYCFDVLPYAYVFGISNEFIEKFESLFKFDDSCSYINPRYFRGFESSCRSSMAPSKENGGISSSSGSGGGFSGGGCGGGGGGSW